MQHTEQLRHVVVIGGGAAGMACASTLSKHPDRFKVTLIEKEDVVGGQATSIPIDEQKHGASWINNGVQGGSSIFKHTFNFLKRYGTPPKEVQLQVSFGKGKSGFWSNCFPSQLVNLYAADIKKFGVFLKVIKWTLPIFGVIPISTMLKVFMFSTDFGNKMVYPLIALFLGTGNQTPHVPSGIVERLFNDPNMKLWDYDADTLLPNLPTMYTFGNLQDFYSNWRQDLLDRGVSIRNSTEVCKVLHRSEDHIVIRTKDEHGEEKDETFDRMVLCTLADESLRILGSNASRRERFMLGGARFYDDVTVTHSDIDYFDAHYETRFDPSLCGEPKSEAQQAQIQHSTKNFKPMYFTLSYDQEPKLIEMSFNCSNYQHQFRNRPDHAIPIYQSIFLDRTRRDLWTIDKINKDKIIKENWWHQLGHRWEHYIRVVPGMMFLQGRHNTFFAGSWTLVNMHEVACVSGIAAAYHLGADYEVFDDFALDFFCKYLLLSHGMMFSREEKKKKKKAKAE